MVYADLLGQFGPFWDWSRDVLPALLHPHVFLQATLFPISFNIHSLLSSAASETRTLPELEKEAERS